MGLLDDLMGQAGGVTALAAKNPAAMRALLGLLSSRDTSIGGSAGLGGVIAALTKGGLGDAVSSWISTGPNPPVSGQQVSDALGGDLLSQFARKAGVPNHEAGGLLASLLPAVVDQLTPAGTVPETETLESTLGGLLGSLRG